MDGWPQVVVAICAVLTFLGLVFSPFIRSKFDRIDKLEDENKKLKEEIGDLRISVHREFVRQTHFDARIDEVKTIVTEMRRDLRKVFETHG